MKISNTAEIILKKNRTIQITEKFNTLNTKILLDFNNKIFVKDEKAFEKTKSDGEILIDFSLFSEDVKTKRKVKMAQFTLNAIPSLRDLSAVKMFTAWIKVYKLDSDKDPIVFTFNEKDSNLLDIINVFKHLSLYLKEYGKVINDLNGIM